MDWQLFCGGLAMKAIHIPQLTQATEQTEVVEVNEFLLSLETLTPIQGQIQITHQGNYLDVLVQAETIVTLSCDRCLQQYNHRLITNACEIIWLDEVLSATAPEPVEVELAPEDLVETLPARGYFDPNEWLYEQLCLAIPQRQLCEQQCPGIRPVAGRGSDTTFDRRWAALAALKQNQFQEHSGG